MSYVEIDTHIYLLILYYRRVELDFKILQSLCETSYSICFSKCPFLTSFSLTDIF